MRRSNVALRLQTSLYDEAKRISKTDGVALNHFINMAVAEKISALRTEEYFRERGKKGEIKKALEILKKAGKGNPPMPGDELDLAPPTSAPPKPSRKPGRRVPASTGSRR